MGRELSHFLPPQEYWLFEKGDLVPTPVDERGLVVASRVVQAVKASIDPAYLWARKRNVHHLYPEPDNYPYDTLGIVNPHFFRELPTSKGVLPIDFHALLHERLIPPESPALEVMRHQVESWTLAARLFHNMNKVINNERQTRRRREFIKAKGHEILSVISPGTLTDRIGEEYLASEFEKHFEGHEHYMELAQQVPAEFRLFNPTDPFEKIAADLGKVVMPKAMPLYLAAAA